MSATVRESDVSQDELATVEDLDEDDPFAEDVEDDLDDDLDGGQLSGYDDDDDESDVEVDEDLDVAAALDATGDADDEDASGQPVVDLAVIDGLEEVAAGTEPDDDEGLREDEFVCRSCHMARRGSALADADQMLCRDCV